MTSKPSSDDTAEYVARLRQNRTDGASVLARHAIRYIGEFAHSARNYTSDTSDTPTPDRVRAFCIELERARPSMAA
ncbi:MAG: hypothetical protein O7H39_04295, partial [Gammaproteobacteria bacterium]|nr:hypothetical protein [Gammaproteobacteria bacterium]